MGLHEEEFMHYFDFFELGHEKYIKVFEDKVKVVKSRNGLKNHSAHLRIIMKDSPRKEEMLFRMFIELDRKLNIDNEGVWNLF